MIYPEKSATFRDHIVSFAQGWAASFAADLVRKTRNAGI
jgi:hypothetical protein